MVGKCLAAGRHWPVLHLDDGDLAITTDYRDVLAEIVGQRLLNDRLDEVFPDYRPNALGLFQRV